MVNPSGQVGKEGFVCGTYVNVKSSPFSVFLMHYSPPCITYLPRRHFYYMIRSDVSPKATRLPPRVALSGLTDGNVRLGHRHANRNKKAAPGLVVLRRPVM